MRIKINSNKKGWRTLVSPLRSVMEKTISFVSVKNQLFKKHEKRCSICGCKEKIEVHHKNCNPFDNREDNLMILCSGHHSLEHDRIGHRRSNRNEVGYPKKDLLVIEMDEEFHQKVKVRALLEKKSIKQFVFELIIQALRRTK